MAKQKEENKMYFCSLCPYVATSYEELDLHYTLEHEDTGDISYELEYEFANKKTDKKKAKSLKERAIKELKLLIEGRTFKEEYIGTCFQRYYIGRLGNTITLLPYATIC